MSINPMKKPEDKVGTYLEMRLVERHIKPEINHEHEVGIYIQTKMMPRFEKCKDGKLHTDGCVSDKVEAFCKDMAAFSGRIRGLFAKLPLLLK